VYNFLVAALQLQKIENFGAIRPLLFAYNELPTIAVAIDCWFRARLIRRALFYGPLPNALSASQYIQALRRSR
jgi:hypothetical protein